MITFEYRELRRPLESNWTRQDAFSKSFEDVTRAGFDERYELD